MVRPNLKLTKLFKIMNESLGIKETIIYEQKNYFHEFTNVGKNGQCNCKKYFFTLSPKYFRIFCFFNYFNFHHIDGFQQQRKFNSALPSIAVYIFAAINYCLFFRVDRFCAIQGKLPCGRPNC